MSENEQHKKADKMPEWTSPLASHPSAVLHQGEISKWITAAYRDLHEELYSGHVFLYNISLETFRPALFRTFWLPIYGQPSNDDGENIFGSVHIMLPWHRMPTARLAEWLNWDLVAELIAQLEQPGSWANDPRVRRVMEKTYVSFVHAPEESQMAVEGDPVAAYATAHYFAFPLDSAKADSAKQIESVIKKALLEIDVKDVASVPDSLIDNVRLLMGAGIAEPFSLRSKGYYSYNFLLSFAGRNDYRPVDHTRCIIRHHIRDLARLWQNCSALPSTLGAESLGRCIFIERNHDVYSQKEMRLDAFLLWARKALRPEKLLDRTRWCFKERLLSPAIEDQAKTAFSSNYSAWSSQLERKERLSDLLAMPDVNLDNYELFPGSLYCRRPSVRDSLNKKLCINLELLLSTKTTPLDPLPENSLFFVTADAGVGKSTFIKALKAHLRAGATNGRLRKYILAERTLKDRGSYSDDFAKLIKEAEKHTDPTVIIIDEAHKAIDFGTFMNDFYNYFDVNLMPHSPIIGIFLTSECSGNELQLEEWVAGKDCRPDVARRFKYIGLPVWNAEDEAIILAAKLLKVFNLPQVLIERRTLDFLIIDQPYDRKQLLQNVEDIIRSKSVKGILQLSDFRYSDEFVRSAMVRRTERQEEIQASGLNYPWGEGDYLTFKSGATRKDE